MKNIVNIDLVKALSKQKHVASVLQNAFPYGAKSLIPFYNTYKWLEPLAIRVVESANLSSQRYADNIKEIIQSGSANNVDEMNITVDNDIGVDIGGDLSPVGIPVDIKFKAGAKGKTIINVKYK